MARRFINPRRIVQGRRLASAGKNFLGKGKNKLLGLGKGKKNSFFGKKDKQTKVKGALSPLKQSIQSISQVASNVGEDENRGARTKIQRIVEMRVNNLLPRLAKGVERRVNAFDPAEMLGKIFGSGLGELQQFAQGLQNLMGPMKETMDFAVSSRKIFSKLFKDLAKVKNQNQGGGGGGAGNIFTLLGLGAGALGIMGAVDQFSEAREEDRIREEEETLLEKKSTIVPSTEERSSALKPEGTGSDEERFNKAVEKWDKVLDFISKKQQERTATQSASTQTTSSTSSTSMAGKSTGPSSYAPTTGAPEAVKDDTDFQSGVTELAKKYNVPEDYLYAVMSFESGGTFDPAQKNMAGAGATGLIQFMPETARNLGTTTEALSKMTRTEQLQYVDKYFQGTLKKGGSLSDVYMSVLLPAAVGKPEDFVLFGEGGAYGGDRAYEQNKGLDANKDGKITKAEATAKVAAHLPEGTSLQPGETDVLQRQESGEVLAQVPGSDDTPTVQVNNVQTDANSEAPSRAGQKVDLGDSQAAQTVPFLSPFQDNMHIMYSRIQYNIIDA